MKEGETNKKNEPGGRVGGLGKEEWIKCRQGNGWINRDTHMPGLWYNRYTDEVELYSIVVMEELSRYIVLWEKKDAYGIVQYLFLQNSDKF